MKIIPCMLLYEPGWDSLRGNAELLKYVTKNPNNYTLEDVETFTL